ncbi:MAG: pyridoxamine 5'-phosphate oxidase family protein, partial [Nitrososphaerota archaeon]|nr:pyridoxamine 5'-phosphate oxidase family protein [Nitrososphaerota archaeon]
MPKLSEKAKKLLEGKNFAFVATLNKDGTPQLTPTWVDTDGENLLVNTALGIPEVPSVTVESACSSSSAALHEAFVHVAGGFLDAALVVGVEKL